MSVFALPDEPGHDPWDDRPLVEPALAGDGTSRVEQLRDRMLTSAELDALPPAQPLVDGVLWRDTLVELWGRPGCGKSFVALDWALCVATGKAWLGRPVRQGRVLYVVGEGLAGLGKRRRAWSYAWRQDDTSGVTWLRGAVPLMEEGWVEALALACRQDQYALVVVDTLSRAIAGHNENAPETMSAVVAASDRIREAAAGACVLFVHHATKDGNTNRGHSALEGACDVRWKLVKEDVGLVLSNPKTKDEAEAPDLDLQLRTIELDHESSCVVEVSHGGPLAADELTTTEATLLAVMRDSFGTTGATSTQLLEVSGIPSSSYHRARNSLLRRGALLNMRTQRQPLYVLPDIGEAT